MRLAIFVACLALVALARGDMDMDDYERMMPTVWEPTTNFDSFQDTEQCRLAGAPFCSDCENPGVRCYGCSWGYVLNVDYSGCTACSEGCRRCQWTSALAVQTECRRCFSSYVLNDALGCDSCGNLCLECEITAIGQVCNQCWSRSVLSNLVPADCISCGPNCATCTADAVDSISCTSCDAGYFVNENRVCESCQSNCLACTEADNTKICSSCVGNYQVSNNGETCLPCALDCASCAGESSVDSTQAACTSCVDGYYLDGETCEPCTSFCTSCSDANSCATCADNYYLVDGAACNPCGWNCKECPDDTTCTTCIDGYTTKPTIDTTCDACPTNCDVCTVEQAAVRECTTCSTGYYLSDSKCVACGSNCDVCSSSTTCITCSADYVKWNDPDSTAASCHACPANCADDAEPICSYNGTTLTAYCTTCVTDYAINDDLTQCIQCQAGCDTCKYNSTYLTTECICSGDVGIDIVDSATYSQVFRGGCEFTTNTYACLAGYFYDPAGLANQGVPTCSSCSITGCDHCNVTDTGNTCYDCDTTNGYSQTASNGQCQACSRFGSQCLTCSDTACLTCSEGYSVYTGNAVGSTSGNCKVCGTNCATCSFSGDPVVSTCTDCKAASVRSNDNTANCVRCTSPCTVCSISDSTTVCGSNGCPSNYVHDGVSECLACPENCDACDLVDGAVVCTTCASNYGVDASGGCTACPRSCSTCFLSTEEGSTDLVCSTCLGSYVLNGLQCAPCPTNCPTCTHSVGTIRGASAADAYYLDNEDGSCSRCPANCEDCSATKCNECVDGYSLSLDSKSCVACPAATDVSNCYECTDAISMNGVAYSMCEDCNAGYVLSDDKTMCSSVADLTNCYHTADHGIECITCDANTNGRYLVSQADFYHKYPKLCAFDCHRCGQYNFDEQRIESGTPDECDSEPEQIGKGRNKQFVETGNYTTGDFCYDGFCATWVEFDIGDKKKSVRSRACRGCNRNSTCDGEADENGGVEQCVDYAKVKGQIKKKQPEKCMRCSKNDRGNADYYSAADTVTGSLAVVLFALSYFVYNNRQ